MTNFPFDMQLVVDPYNTSNVVANGQVFIYDPADTGNTSPLALTDANGLPLTNPLMSNANGFLPPFVATVPQVKWAGSGFVGFFDSYAGLRDVALDAVAKLDGFTIGTVETIDSPAPASATVTGDESKLLNLKIPRGLAGLNGSNVLPDDAAVAQAVGGAASQTQSALTSWIVAQINTAGTVIRGVLNAIFVRKGELFLNAKDYGAVGDGVADDTAALQAWLDAGGIRLFGGDYRITGELVMNGDYRRLYTDNAAIIADTPAETVMLTASGAEPWISVALDGGNTARMGIRTTGARPRITNCRIRNLHSATNSARAIECTTSLGAVIEDNDIRGIHATGDSTFGNGRGMARAIVITSTTPAQAGTRIANNYIDGVTGEEGDAIAVLFNDPAATIFLPSMTVIENNKIRNASRRFIKVQGSGCTVRNNIIEHDGAIPSNPSNAIDFINSHDATVTGNEIGPNPLSTAISVVGAAGAVVTDALISNNIIRRSDTQNSTTIFLNYTLNANVSNNTIHGGGTGIAVGFSTATLIDSNTHYDGIASERSFQATSNCTNVVMRKNLNMNKARTNYISNASVGPITDLNATLT